jgi:hypothetical protein
MSAARYTITASGDRLHGQFCPALDNAEQHVMTRGQACAWLDGRPLSRGICGLCRPADPRKIRAVP